MRYVHMLFVVVLMMPSTRADPCSGINIRVYTDTINDLFVNTIGQILGCIVPNIPFPSFKNSFSIPGMCKVNYDIGNIRVNFAPPLSHSVTIDSNSINLTLSGMGLVTNFTGSVSLSDKSDPYGLCNIMLSVSNVSFAAGFQLGIGENGLPKVAVLPVGCRCNIGTIRVTATGNNNCAALEQSLQSMTLIGRRMITTRACPLLVDTFSLKVAPKLTSMQPVFHIYQQIKFNNFLKRLKITNNFIEVCSLGEFFWDDGSGQRNMIGQANSVQPLQTLPDLDSGSDNTSGIAVTMSSNCCNECLAALYKSSVSSLSLTENLSPQIAALLETNCGKNEHCIGSYIQVVNDFCHNSRADISITFNSAPTVDFSNGSLSANISVTINTQCNDNDLFTIAANFSVTAKLSITGQNLSAEISKYTVSVSVLQLSGPFNNAANDNAYFENVIDKMITDLQDHKMYKIPHLDKIPSLKNRVFLKGGLLYIYFNGDINIGCASPVLKFFMHRYVNFSKY